MLCSYNKYYGADVMYIKFETFSEFLKAAGKIKGVSPGWVAKDFGVVRQTVSNWVNADVLDAYFYEGREGQFVLLDLDDYSKIIQYRNRVS